MARKNTPCEFCEKDNLYSDSAGANQLVVEFYPDNRLLAIAAYGKDSDGEEVELEFSFRINYCPMCGKKIGYS